MISLNDFFSPTKIITQVITIWLTQGIMERIYLKIKFKVSQAAYINKISTPKIFNNKNIINSLVGDNEIVKLINICMNTKLFFKNEIYQQLLEKVNNKEETFYSYNRWRTLSSFFIANGMFRLGYICRKKAIKNLFERKRQRGDEWRKAIAEIEMGHLDNANALLEDVAKKFYGKLLKEDIFIVKNYIRLLQGRNFSSFLINNNFKKYINGGDCIIIGPADKQEDRGISDKTNKIIIKNNISDSKKQKANIAYYNATCSYKLDFDMKSNLDWIVLKNKDKKVHEDNKTRRCIDLDSVLFLGTCTVLPLMICDLKSHGAASIYVSGNNLFLSKRPHSTDYIRPHMAPDEFKRSIAVHDMFSQLIILKAMFDSGFFIANDELKHVLQLSPGEYAEEMEEIWNNVSDG